EKAEALQQLAELREAQSVNQSAAEQRLAELGQSHEIATREKAEALQQLEELRKAQSLNQSAAESARVESSAILARLRTENERAVKERELAEAEAEKMFAEIDRLRVQRQQEHEKFE